MKTKKETLILHVGEASEFPVALNDEQFAIHHAAVCAAMDLAQRERRRAQLLNNFVFFGFVIFSVAVVIWKMLRERGVKAAPAA